MKTIDIDQSLSNSTLLNINFLKTSRNYTNMLVSVMTKTILTYIIEAAMVSTPELFTNNSTRSPMTSTQVKKSIAINHCVFSLTY